MNLLEFRHQPQHDARQRVNGQFLDRRLALEQAAIERARNDGDAGFLLRLHPGRIEEVVEERVDGEDAGFAGGDLVERGFLAAGRLLYAANRIPDALYRWRQVGDDRGWLRIMDHHVRNGEWTEARVALEEIEESSLREEWAAKIPSD